MDGLKKQTNNYQVPQDSLSIFTLPPYCQDGSAILAEVSKIHSKIRGLGSSCPEVGPTTWLLVVPSCLSV
jgi:hypothetical protein